MTWRNGTVESLLGALSNAFGPPGREEEVAALIARELEGVCDEIRFDAMGNLLARSGKGLPGPVAMIAAHMDEVGLIIDAIEESGVLRFKKVGGIDDRLLPSKRVRVGKSKLPGVIGAKPVHLQKGDEKERVVESDSLFIDIGAASRAEAEQWVSIGDYAVFDTAFQPLGEGLVAGKALDDRAGCAMAVALARRGTPLPTVFAFTAQEEVGLRGAGVAAYREEPDFAVILEATSCADMPDPDDRRHATRLGSGPALTFQDATSIPHPRLLSRLVATAERHGIPYQWKKTTAGGNDGGSIQRSRGGLPIVSVSLPCRYIHSPRSILSLADLEHGVDLVYAFLADIAAEGGF